MKGKVALVTGGSSGIGMATALAFAKRGAKVVTASRGIEKGEKAVKMIQDAGGEAVFIQTDVSKADQVERLIDKTVETYGRLDCAFNNAGIAGALAETADCTEEDWDISMSVNLKSVWLCMKYEIIQMLKQENGGAIVNTGSAAGLVALPGAAAYAVAKHGIVGLTKTAAIEYVTRGIRINTVCPSFVGTPLTQQVNAEYPDFVKKAFALQPIGRVGTPDEIAASVVWLCSDAASFVTGAAFAVDGGYVAQ
jgi:NAD(P)-dependent dehydrogenase (short-subunit alcohol dehydrogenase family)